MGAALIDNGIHASEPRDDRLDVSRGEVDPLVAELLFKMKLSILTDNLLIHIPILLFDIFVSLAAIAVLAERLKVVHGGLAAARDGDDMVDV